MYWRMYDLDMHPMLKTPENLKKASLPPPLFEKITPSSRDRSFKKKKKKQSERVRRATPSPSTDSFERSSSNRRTDTSGEDQDDDQRRPQTDVAGGAAVGAASGTLPFSDMALQRYSGRPRFFRRHRECFRDRSQNRPPRKAIPPPPRLGIGCLIISQELCSAWQACCFRQTQPASIARLSLQKIRP